MRTQLLCTFVETVDLHNTISTLILDYTILFNKIYVLRNELNRNQLLCTYNIEENRSNFISDSNTISLHRKKHTNTLYTINSLNEIIRSENNGKLDKSYQVDWEKYRNCLLLNNSTGVVRIPTQLYIIVDTKKWSKK